MFKESHMNKISVINKGFGGDNTIDGLARIKKDVLAYNPNHFIILFGFNDALWHPIKFLPLKNFRSNLREMVAVTKKSGIEHIVLLTLFPVIEKYIRKRHPTHPAKDINAYIEGFNQVILEVATESGIMVVNLKNLITMHGGASEDKSCMIRNVFNSGAEDGVHLTPEGYRLMAELIYDAIKQKIKCGDTIVCFGDSITYGVHVKGAGTVEGETYPAQLSRIVNITEFSQ